MDTTDVAHVIKQHLAQIRGVSTDEVEQDCGVGGVIDSLEGLQLILALEAALDVSLPMETLDLSILESPERLRDLVNSMREVKDSE